MDQWELWNSKWKRLINIVYTNKIEQLEKLKRLNKVQKDLIKLDITDINRNTDDRIVIDDNDEVENDISKNIESDVYFPQYIKIFKKRKGSKTRTNVDIYNIRDMNKDNIYEIEEIINNKIGDNKSYAFFVKWKNYDNKNNTWVNENDFNKKDIIHDYFLKKNIIYR